MSLDRIIIHMTNSPYIVAGIDKYRFHYVIDQLGNCVAGRFSPDDNSHTKTLTKGTYAAHTKGLSSGSIGIGLSGSYKVSSTYPTPYPITKKQKDALINLLVELVKKYNITPQKTTIVLSTEVEAILNVTQPLLENRDFDYDISISDELEADKLSLSAHIVKKVYKKILPLHIKIINSIKDTFLR